MPKAKTQEKESSFEVGMLVSFEWEGETKQGTITKINAKKEEAEVEGDDLPDGLVCEFDEMTVVTKEKAAPKKKAADPDDDPKPKGKAGTKSFGALFNSKPPAEGGQMGLPIGTHECLVADGLCATNDKGTSAYIELALVNPEDEDNKGKSGRRFYQLADPEGEPLDGIGYLKTDLILCGLWDEDHEVESSTLEDFVEELNTWLKKLKKKLPWVSVNVVKGKQGYNNIYLQSLMEDQDQKPELPE